MDRRGYIGGSDIAGIMGLSVWDSPLSIWAVKTGNNTKPFKMTEAMEMGHIMEPVIADMFSKKTGLKVRRDTRHFSHDTYPYMKANIDRWIVGGFILECKTCTEFKSRDWAGEEIPVDYILQVNWYLGILKKKEGYIAVVIGGNKYLHKKIVFKQSLFDTQVECAKNFWENFVLPEIPPMAMSGDTDSIKALHPESSDEMIVVAGGDLEETVNQLIIDRLEGKKQIHEIDKIVDEAEAKLKQMVGDKLGIETGQYSMTWRTSKTTRWDMKKIIDKVDCVNEMLDDFFDYAKDQAIKNTIDRIRPVLLDGCKTTTKSRTVNFKEKKS